MLKIHCDNPACETETEWSERETLPLGWYEITVVVADGDEAPAWAVCHAGCIPALHELLLSELEETRGDV